MKKSKFSTYNDGVVYLYREKERKTNFAAKQNVSVLEDMDFIVKLCYEETSKRQQDIEFAEQMDFSLSMKIKTPYFKGIENKFKAVINNYLYDIVYIDNDKKEMWLYLEGIRGLSS